ncbi:MAG: septation ring formation regulator EzrA [Bacilli bacterium]|nr:septation ring formation regulator EzrA [Bacilli bacterium]
MNSKLILPMILFLASFIIIIVVLLIVQNKRKNKYKEVIEKLDYEKNKLIGVPILSELSKVKELVKTDDLKQKLNEWDETFKDIKENKIDMLTDLITEADFMIDRKDYKSSMKKIAYVEILLESLKKKTENLLEEVKVITKSEERNRSIITKLKAIYRDCENKYERTKKDYGPLSDSIESCLDKIDKEFKKFESLMDKNDYVSVEKLVIKLEKDINILKIFLEKTPDLVLISTMMIPNKIEETKTLYFRMQRDGFPLDYLNIEYNIKEIGEKVDNILEKLKKFELENADIELKTMLEYFNTIFNSFDKERESKDIFRENIKKLKKKLEGVNRVVYDIYLQMDDIKNTYDLTEAEINKFNIINKSLEKINEDYKILFEHGKGKTFAYSKLVEELDGLGNRLTRLQDDLDYRLKSITSMKDDEYRAKEQLDMIQNLLIQSKNKLKEYKIPVIPNSYYIELEEASEAIREIIKELAKKPIVIKILNIRVDTARDLVFKIYNKTNDIVKSVITCERLITYGNRYRTNYKEIDDNLIEAEELFKKGKYKQSMELSIKAISIVDEYVASKFDLEK